MNEVLTRVSTRKPLKKAPKIQKGLGKGVKSEASEKGAKTWKRF